jgi:transposase
MPSVEREPELNDRLWERVRPLLPRYTPGPKGGRPRADDRAGFEAVVFMPRNGLRWRDLPDHFPSPATVWRRHAGWTGEGVREQVWRVARDEPAEAGLLDTSELYLDCTFAPAQKGGGPRSARPGAVRG